MTNAQPGPITEALATQTPIGKGLAPARLGIWGSTVIGLASTAPLFSLAATLGFVVIAVGEQAPIAFILAFIPMMFTAFAYRELNRAVPERYVADVHIASVATIETLGAGAPAPVIAPAVAPTVRPVSF